MKRITAAGVVQLVRMSVPFTFNGLNYSAGGWMQLAPIRRALTHLEYMQLFSTPPEPEW